MELRTSRLVAYDATSQWQPFVSTLVIRWCRFDFYANALQLRACVSGRLQLHCNAAQSYSESDKRTMNYMNENESMAKVRKLKHPQRCRAGSIVRGSLDEYVEFVVVQ